PRLAARLSKDAHQFAFPGEHLDAVVAGVGDVEVAVRAEGQGASAGELAGFGAGAAPAFHELAVLVELADALVLAELGDVVKTVLVLHHVADVVQVARFGAGAGADAAQLLALGGINAKTVVVGIADDEVAVVIDAQSAGAAVAVVGSGPGVAEVFAVAVVNLDAGGVIDDVQAILTVDGDGAGADEIAVLNAAAAPDDFGFGPRPAAGVGEQTQGAGGQTGGQTERAGDSFSGENAHYVIAFRVERRRRTCASGAP